MYRIYNCITQEHDYRLVLAAAVICFLAAYTAFNLVARAGHARPRARRWWIGTAALVIGSGIWATHFIAMLGFKPPIPIHYDVELTALSIVIAVVISAVGFAISARTGFVFPFLGGAAVGLGIAAMHYIGIYAWRLEGIVQLDYAYVIASALIGGVGGGLALSIGARGSNFSCRLLASVVLGLTICVMHFTGMAAVVVLPDPTIAVTESEFEPIDLAIAVGAVTVLIVALSLGSAILDERLASRAVRESAALRRQVRARTSALAASEARLVDAIETLPEAFALFDSEDRLVVCNDAYRGMHDVNASYVRPGIKFEELARRFSPSDEFTEEEHGDARWLAGRMQQRCAIDAEGRRSERHCKDGRWLEIHERRMRDGGIVTLVIDVTESRNRMAALAEHDKLTALGQLAGGVAHEINNLLQPALVFPEMVRDSLPESETELREYLDTVTASTRAARDIVKSILLFAREDSRQDEARLETVDLAAEIDHTLKFVHSLMPPGISLELHNDGAGKAADINKTELTQVLTNLVVNAAHASGGQGVVDISLRRSWPSPIIAKNLGLAEGSDYWMVAVEDHGTGMDDQTKARIFEPFFTTKPQGSGTGLGLSVVHGIVRGWHGAISVKSELGVGTTFTIFIPIAEQAPLCETLIGEGSQTREDELKAAS